MNWLRRIFYRWMQSEANDQLVAAKAPSVSVDSDGTDHKVTFTIIDAMNGKLIQIGRYKPNPRGPDWTYQNYIVREGESLAEAFVHLTVLTQLEK